MNNVNSTPNAPGNEEMADVIVIGGGPGGYPAAIRAAQLGGKVVLIERDSLGGTCLNRGCIPTKALIKSTEFALAAEEAHEMGIELSYNGYNLDRLRERKNKVVAQLVMGIDFLVKKRKIELLKGHARFVNQNTVEVNLGGSQTVIRKAKKIIIATGSKSSPLKMENADLPAFITSDDALELKSIPKKIVILGAGAIGIEFAFIYRNLGCDVAIAVRSKILRKLDQDVVAVLDRVMKKRGIKVYNGAQLQKINKAAEGVSLDFATADGTLTLEADQVLVALGRDPETEGLNLEAAGVKTEKGCIVVNKSMETNVPGIYAIGDVTGGLLLAHVATEEGIVAAENAMGHSALMDYRVVPSCIYGIPELATVGMTEEEAKEAGYQVKTGKFPFNFSGKALAVGAPDGLAKIVADEESGEILGVHIVGERATDLIAEAAIAMKMEATVEEIIATIHAHPTMAETLMEAASAVQNRAIHLP